MYMLWLCSVPTTSLTAPRVLRVPFAIAPLCPTAMFLPAVFSIALLVT
jgi:hypothetical protein